ncbi:hypothetical protein, partial [Flavobacterium sp. ALJ2]|uniref:hypothetical protein n=1 Tax=Flavobacterium sp. ALJ2 TaxID=2786960 RepID=UPI001E3522AC
TNSNHCAHRLELSLLLVASHWSRNSRTHELKPLCPQARIIVVDTSCWSRNSNPQTQTIIPTGSNYNCCSTTSGL